jgi:hypothetical protein
MAIPASSCSVFVQVWVDTNALQRGDTTGVYLVDNNLNHGSSQEGTVNLVTDVPVSTNICWSLLNVDPNSNAILSLQNFGDSSVFGFSGTPQQVNPTTWTGQVQAAGQAQYGINFNTQIPGQSGITTRLNPTLSVH